MKCTACEKELNKKETVFTEDRKPYCSNPFNCNDKNPNSVANIVARGGAIKMYTEEQLENSRFDLLKVSPELKERIRKVATKPQSIRLSIDNAHYLVLLQETEGFNSISEAVRYCIDKAEGQRPVEIKDYNENRGEEQPVELQDLIPVIPKSVNVNWDDVEKNKGEIKYPLPTEDEEEFTF